MNANFVLVTVSAFFALTTIAFAGLFAWQYQIASGNVTTSSCLTTSVPQLEDDNICPYYPEPQDIGGLISIEFYTPR